MVYSSKRLPTKRFMSLACVWVKDKELTITHTQNEKEINKQNKTKQKPFSNFTSTLANILHRSKMSNMGKWDFTTFLYVYKVTTSKLPQGTNKQNKINIPEAS